MTQDQQLRRIKRLIVINLLGGLHILAAICLLMWALIDTSLLESKWPFWVFNYLIITGIALSWPREIKK